MKVENIPTPALIIDLDAMERNMETMNGILARGKLALRPHYKSNKCNDIVKMQLARGAKGITCAKLSEAYDLVEAGTEDVLIANEIQDKGKLAEVARLANCCHLAIAMDSMENIRNLEAAAAVQGSTVYCLVEYEIGMGRCGVDNLESAYALAKAITESPHLKFQGIQAYAGHLSHEENKEVRREKAEQIESRLAELVLYLKERGIETKEVSGCSTASVYDHAFPGTVYTEIQAGSYLFMDAAYNLLKDLEFENSLFVLTTVMSNARGRTIVDGGRKSISVDQAPAYAWGYENLPLKLSEEHSVFEPAEALPIGSKVRIVPSHCCTCMNLHDMVYFVRDGRVVNKVPVTSRGRSV